MIRYLLMTLALTLVLLGYSSWVIKRQYTQSGVQQAQIAQMTQALKTAQGQRKLDQAVLARRALENATAARLAASLRQELDRSLTQNREWADSRVPKEVQDALK